MNQHSIQEAYLKNFCDSGRVWTFHKLSDKVLSKPIRKCTVENDFQPEWLEKLQNDMIESPGIKKLRKLILNSSITSEEFDIIKYWSALHILRNKKFREMLGEDYLNNFNKYMAVENIFNQYLNYGYVATCNVGKYFITSDNPVCELSIGVEIVRFLTLSPNKLILFSPVDSTVSHSKLEFTELINTIILANAYSEIYSNKKNVPITKYKENIAKLGIYVTLNAREII